MGNEHTFEELEQRRARILDDPDSDPNPGDTLQWLDRLIERRREGHEFHLLTRLVAYCVCGWWAEIEYEEDQESADRLNALSRQWKAHIPE